MIGTTLIGGLGNQMFQYAAARALALRHRTELALDLSSFGRSDLGSVARHFELDRLMIDALPRSRSRDLSFLLARRRQIAMQRMSGWKILRETSLSYNPAFESAPNSTYMFGYWQSWRYFRHYEAQIARDLQPRIPLSSRNLAMQQRMRTSSSLSLHVRRGDYLHAAHAAHGSLSLDFYIDAVAKIAVIEPGLEIFVFSDDLDWCRQAFTSFDWALTFVDWNRSEDSWQDLFLMSACRHAVIANSSFSWWGAWLGDQQTQTASRTVIAPRKWFAEGDASIVDRCPPTWILL